MRPGAREDRSTPLRRACLSKAGYWTLTQAKDVAQRREFAGAPKLRVYHCPHCLRYHLSKLISAPVEPRKSQVGVERFERRFGRG